MIIQKGKVVSQIRNSANITKSKKSKDFVILGMSGGVDSSVAAILLQKQGYEVIGVFMKNYSDSKDKLTGECSWREELRMARKVAVIFGIKLYVVNYEKEYKTEVIEPMFKAYSRGLTPNPDTECNKIVKFPALFKKAKELGADFIATGHYVRVKSLGRKKILLRGKDEEKDQSYFLYELKNKDLEGTLFPIGNLKKEKVREIAKKAKLPNWDKQGTRGICFVGQMDMKEFLKKRIKEKTGKVLNDSGGIIGTHWGSVFYTIGERVGEAKGVEIFSNLRKGFEGKKLYVAEKRKGNILVVVPEGHELLRRKEVMIRRLSLVDAEEKIYGKRFRARIRHLGEFHSGKIIRARKKIKFVFDRGVEGVAEGQAIVLYSGERVVGGGEMRFG